jgi:hypothetical protein
MMIEIIHRFTREIIFSYDCENNTIKKTVEEAVKLKIDLRYSDLSGENLREADLRGAYLGGSDLRYTDLRYSDLSDADLRGADLRGSYLQNANLSSSNLRYSYLGGSDLRNVITNHLTEDYHLACPEIGSFVGYKKCRNSIIVTLQILEDSKRSSATSSKCRASKVKVLALSHGEKAYSLYDSNFSYEVGQIIEIEDFDNNRWNECSKGIHFFMNKEAAMSFNY